METRKTSKSSLETQPTYSDYLSSGLVPLLCNGYHPDHNPGKVYKIAKIPTYGGWTSSEYVPPTIEEITTWEKAGGWTGWKPPREVIGLDVEDPDDVARVREICRANGIEPGVHRTNNGFHFFFSTPRDLKGDSRVQTQCGLEVTYRVWNNQVILAPINGRTWELWKTPADLPLLPGELLPYDRKDPSDVLNGLAWSVRKAQQEGSLSGYEDVDVAVTAFLIEYRLSDEQIHSAFQLIFLSEYDERRTEQMIDRTRQKIQAGDPIVGTGSFIHKLKELDLKLVARFVRELQAATGEKRVTVEEWPDPVPFDAYSSLPDFPVDALFGIGREMVEAVSEVNQVDPALVACQYLGTLSACCARKTRTDLISHSEPSNLYFCPVSNSGTRKSSTQSAMVHPLYEYQKDRQEAMSEVIREAQNAFRIKEKRLDRLQKKAAEEDDPIERQRTEQEASDLARDMAESPVPRGPVYLVDDITPEKLGVLMAENNECMAVISPEGGLFEIMAGRYSKDGVGNIDLPLKAHAGDYWSNHRIGREANTMQTPALTLCLAVQSEVIEEAGKNHHFRGKGLLARFLYALCRSTVGYRDRQTKSVPSSLLQCYREHVFSLMDMPFSESALRLSPDAQALWDEFYGDIETEMRPGGSLCYLPDWGSKLPGAAARIAGLLHLAEHGVRGLSLPISVNIVGASCMIGAFFKEHAIAVFGLMQEDRRFKLARQIRDYVMRVRPEIFTGRNVLHHTSIGLIEDVDLGIKVLLDRGYIRGDTTDDPKDNRGPGRPKGRGYIVNPKIFEKKNV